MENKKLKILIIIAIPALLAAGICAWVLQGEKGGFEKSLTTISFDYNQALFYRAIAKYPVKDSGLVVSAIISPHHDTAADYTAELFQKIDNRNIERVIIIGPNHENKGTDDIITAPVTYNYFGGTVFPDNLIEELIMEKMAVGDPSVLQTEHSIYNVLPYINYYFPQARVVPIILSPDVSREKAQELGEYLSEKIDSRTLIIGSIDFSHYLSSSQARMNDRITQEALLNRDYDRLYSFNSDYIDSAPTAVTVLSGVKSDPEIIRNANSADALGIGNIPSSTSYFTILFRR